MRDNTAPQTGSPYNPQNNSDASSTDMTAPTPATTPARSLAERLTEAAVTDLGLKREWVEFPQILVPDRRDDGLYVTDKRGLVEYDLETGELSTTRDFHEMVEVVDHNQHAATNLDQMILG